MKVLKSYTRLLVSDLEACFIFYRDMMEFQVTTDALHDGYADFAAGDMNLALFRRQEMAEITGNAHKPFDAECQDRVVLIFSVPNLEEVYQKLKHKGVKFSNEPMNNPYYGIKTAYLRDPDGNLIGLYQQIV
jgi:predicted enzyme related to lactoylglutathione lyase